MKRQIRQCYCPSVLHFTERCIYFGNFRPNKKIYKVNWWHSSKVKKLPTGFPRPEVVHYINFDSHKKCVRHHRLCILFDYFFFAKRNKRLRKLHETLVNLTWCLCENRQATDDWRPRNEFERMFAKRSDTLTQPPTYHERVELCQFVYIWCRRLYLPLTCN